jgi:Rad3-related DNA helicase
MNLVEQARKQVGLDLRKGGILDQRLPGYEERPAQIQMAEEVARALTTGEHTLIEAGTGTGKSLAYLLPIVRSGQKALISTANKALQEQLFYKDIPFISENVQPVRAALVKGMNNYLCLQHFAEEREGLQRYMHNRAFEQLDDCIQQENFDGDLDVVPFDLPGDIRHRVAADGDDCAWRACPFFHDCFVRKMRETAQQAQLVVINHTLLLIDMLSDGELLPERDLIVIDEAHHLEEEATRAFTVVVSPRVVENLLAQKRLKDYCDQDKRERAITQSALTWGQLADMTHLGTRSRAPLTEPFEEGLRLATAIEEIATDLFAKRPEGLDEKEEQLYDKLLRRTRSVAANLKTVFSVNSTDTLVYYVDREVGRQGQDISLSASAAPYSVQEKLHEQLFNKVSVIATSATLAIDQNFEFFRSRVGLIEARELVLPLAFDYQHNALLYVPRMKHEPTYGDNNRPYLDELANQMGELVRASQGRAFLLFTSQRTLREVLDRLEGPLADEEFTILVQGKSLGRQELLRRFRTEPRAILFGLKSFWEGVDVAGEALSLVAIDKLPFDPPDDPVHEARVSRMKAAGENWFKDYVLPQAILRLKQGIGRLLRTRDDRGVLAILDTRLLTKYYGRQIIFALPPAHRTVRLDDVRSFFADIPTARTSQQEM